MKELLKYIFKLDINALFLKSTENTIIKFFRYIFVGGLAFIVDSSILFVLEYNGLHYLLATAIAFTIGLFVNFILAKKLVFTEKATVNKFQGEFFIYGLVGLIGLLITEGLMYLLTGLQGVYFMISKVIVAIIVLIWNFMARKILLYRNK